MQSFNPSILMLMLVAGKPVINNNGLHKLNIPRDLLEELSPFLPSGLGSIVSIQNALEAYRNSQERYRIQSRTKPDPMELLTTIRNHRPIPALDRIDGFASQAGTIRNEAGRIAKGDLSSLLPSILPRQLTDIMSKVEQMKGMMQMMSLFSADTSTAEAPKDATKLIESLDKDIKDKIHTMGQLSGS